MCSKTWRSGGARSQDDEHYPNAYSSWGVVQYHGQRVNSIIVGNVGEVIYGKDLLK